MIPDHLSAGLNPGQKAHILTEALPYIRRWSGKIVVVKVGGEVVLDPEMLELLVTDIALMRFVGIDVVVVHGGGPQISDAMRDHGKQPVFVNGQRVTDATTMKIVKSVLMDSINSALVAAIDAHGTSAAGVCGEDGNTLQAIPVSADLGFAGQITDVDPRLLSKLIAAESVPVLAPVATGPGGSFNVNADVAAGAIAGALGAQKVVYLTNVAGLYEDLGDEGSLISEVSADGLQKMIDEKMLSDGMIPKIASVVAAIRSGVPQAHILDGRVPHALLLEIFTDEGIGTMVTA